MLVGYIRTFILNGTTSPKSDNNHVRVEHPNCLSYYSNDIIISKKFSALLVPYICEWEGGRVRSLQEGWISCCESPLDHVKLCEEKKEEEEEL